MDPNTWWLGLAAPRFIINYRCQSRSVRALLRIFLLVFRHGLMIIFFDYLVHF